MRGKASVPWSFAELRLLALSTLLGIGGIVAAWWGSSGTAQLHQQSAWTAVAIAASGLVVLGDLLWISSAHRALRTRQETLLETISEHFAETARLSSAGQRDVGMVALPAGSRYHRIDCLLVIGKTTECVQVPTGQTRQRLQPCEMCLP